MLPRRPRHACRYAIRRCSRERLRLPQRAAVRVIMRYFTRFDTPRVYAMLRVIWLPLRVRAVPRVERRD